MAFCVPLHLRQRTSRVYQDHLHLCRVLTSFVPPVHIRGVSLAPLQGLCPMENIPADYRLILCLSVTDFCTIPCPGTFRRTFSRSVPHAFSLPAAAGFSPLPSPQKTQSNRSRYFHVFSNPDAYAACICGLWMSLISFCGS